MLANKFNQGETMKVLLKIISPAMLLISTNCFAMQSSIDPLADNYQKDFKVPPQAKKESNPTLNAVKLIPETTYQYLERVFSSFYHKITFNTSITTNTFKNKLNSDVVAIPLIAENEKGLQLEVFGNFFDVSRPYQSHISVDHALHEHMNNSEQSEFLLDREIALGAGFSFKTSQSSKVKVIISNDDIPGYGNSTTLVGFETRF